MAKIVVPFSISATYVNTLDTAPYTLATIDAASSIVLVPVRLEIWREAGTAYTITPKYTGDGVTSDVNALFPYVWEGQFDPHKAHLEPLYKTDDFIVYDTNALEHSGRSDRNNIFFRFPMYDLMRTATEDGRVVFPVSGLCLRPGDITVKMEALTGISGGTGSLVGRLFFDEYPAGK